MHTQYTLKSRSSRNENNNSALYAAPNTTIYKVSTNGFTWEKPPFKLHESRAADASSLEMTTMPQHMP